MKIGFVTDYMKNDATSMCLRVGRLALDLGFDVEFYSRMRPTQAHPYWDRFVVREKRGRLEEWLRTLDHAIFTFVPGTKELESYKDLRVRLSLLALWDELSEDDLNELSSFAYVICPGKSSLKLLTHRTHCTNLTIVPWDSGVPITFEPRAVDPANIGVIWPLEWQQAKRQDGKFVVVAEQLLESCPQVWLTVTYSNNIPPNMLRDLRRMGVYGAGRVELLRSASMESQELMFGHHDLTMWPSLTESAALIGLTSLAMGTPLIAFDHPVAGDVIKNNRNGVLVPCELETMGVQVPCVKPDLPGYGRQLVELVKNPETLHALRQNSVVGLRERREVFNSKWKDILTG